MSLNPKALLSFCQQADLSNVLAADESHTRRTTSRELVESRRNREHLCVLFLPWGRVGGDPKNTGQFPDMIWPSGRSSFAYLSTA
mmetsp:Transcript_34528/g.135864  ORF Transcript_34528/g.135864 Transcript_34528/m.135864 type:complete len:85 (+) Transcript_34528:2079-2333(+)